VGKHIRLKTYPANPAKGFEGVKNPLPDGENPCRVVYPAPTRQNPATGVQGVKNPLSDGENPCRVGYPVPPFCRVVSGGCRGIHPTRVFVIRKGVNPSLRGTCRVCRVGFRGSVLTPFLPGTAGYLPGTCRVRYPARILPMGKGINPSSGGGLAGYCRVPAG
jgi:hypothetical protein